MKPKRWFTLSFSLANLLRYSLLITLLLSLFACSEKDFRKAQVLYSGPTQGLLFTTQRSWIAFYGDSGEVQIEQVDLPKYPNIVLAGDSVEIRIQNQTVEFGKHFRLRNRTFETAVFLRRASGRHEHLFLNNGVLTYLVLNNDDELLELIFYNYRKWKSGKGLNVYYLGYPNDFAFAIKGRLSGDRLFLDGQEKHFYKVF